MPKVNVQQSAKCSVDPNLRESVIADTLTRRHNHRHTNTGISYNVTGNSLLFIIIQLLCVWLCLWLKKLAAYSPLPIGSPYQTFPKFLNSSPIGSSDDFCPLFFSALFSASPVPQANPFQSLSLEPFPIDPTHNTLFTSPFDLTLFLHDTPSPDTPFSPTLTQTSHSLVPFSASLFGFTLPSLSLTASSAGAPLTYHRSPLPPPKPFTVKQRSEVMSVFPFGDLWSLVMRHLVLNGDFWSLVMKDRFLFDDFRSLVMKDRFINGDFWSLFMDCVTLVVNLFISKHGRVGSMK
jgi:hypothetical protein